MRPIDLLGGIDYGKWKLSPVLSIPFNTLVPPATNIPGPTTVAGVTYPGIPIAETGILRVIVSVNPGVVFNLSLTRGWPAAPVQQVMAYNAAVALVASSLYLFDVPVLIGDMVNFRVGGILPVAILMLDAGLVITMGP